MTLFRAKCPLKFLVNSKLVTYQKTSIQFSHIINKKFLASVQSKSNLFHNMDNNRNFTILPTPIKSASDKKSYRVIQLKNGLKACLISDPSTSVESESNEELSDAESSSGVSGEGSEDSSVEESDSDDRGHKNKGADQKMAAAAICIGVGSYSDPKDVPGLAHFLEHMVFMGSEKFPEENNFDSFIQKLGGENNASTDTETTTFYFDCLEKHFSTALDKFVQFFISPLMKKDAMTRERESIESEFNMALPSDTSRMEQLICSFAKQESPVNSFSWGNLITLQENVDDDELYRKVHEFRKRHYSAHRMTLALQARLPLDTLQNYVLEWFSNVPNNKLPPLDFSQFIGNVFDTPKFCKMYYVKPIKDLRELEFTWILPPLLDKYKCNPLGYISYLLGDEGKNSLSSYLRNKLWALSVTSNYSLSGNEFNSIYTMYSLTIVLTEEGFNNLYEVISSVFSYIKLLKEIGPKERIYNELQAIGEISFKYAQEEEPSKHVENLSDCMQIFPPEHYLTASELFYEYDPKLISEMTNYLVPEKTNFIVSIKELPENLTFNKKEKWFGTEYCEVDIPIEWLKKWNSIEKYPEFDLPPPNQYLTEDYSILSESSKNHPEYPEKVTSSPLMEMWYRQDQKFKLPEAYYYFYLISPLPLESPSNAALLDITMGLLTFACAEELYPALCANLSYEFGAHEKGMMLKVSGYNNKLPLIINTTAKYLTNLKDYVTENMFEAIKKKVGQSYYGRLMKSGTTAKDIRLQLLVQNYWSTPDKYTSLSKLTFKNFKEFTKNYMDSLYIKVLVQGNVSKTVASDTVNKFVSNLKTNQLPQQNYPLIRVYQIPQGEKCLRAKGFNTTDPNNVIINYYQAGPFSLKLSAIIELVLHIIEEPLFNVLRTKEQLGYQVTCAFRDTFGVLGYSITITSQAKKFSTDHLNKRIEEFIKSTHGILKKMSQSELDEIKEYLVKAKECVDVQLSDEVNRNWSEIVSEDYMFDRVKMEIETIKTITIEEIREWWMKHNLKQEQFRKISVQVVGYDEKQAKLDTLVVENEDISLNIIRNVGKKKKKKNGYFIENIDKFKEGNVLYPPIIETKQ